MSEDLGQKVKISKIKIVYENGEKPEEDALIYIPISQVEGLEESLSWEIVPSTGQKSS